MSCDNIEVHYINYAKTGKERRADVYNVADATIDGEDVIFSWLISKNATGLAGTLTFSVHLGKIGKDEVGNLEEVYIWNTEVVKLITIKESIKNDAAEEEDVPDMLLSLEAQVGSLSTEV
jgi:hypothetical protein